MIPKNLFAQNVPVTHIYYVNLVDFIYWIGKERNNNGLAGTSLAGKKGI